MNKPFCLLSLSLLLAAGAPGLVRAAVAPNGHHIPAAFPTPPETSAAQLMRAALAEGKPAQLNGIQQTMLPNGLTVLTKEVHAAPVVYFAVYYKVGSIDEEIGETGMSHLMEHMMFKGTKTRGPGVISATLQENGASFNASTSFDRTEYHETLAADRLPIAMQIESDRMVNSLFDEAQHQKEMTVVRSEYEAGENNPGTVLGKAVRLSAFQVMPYRWETIGFKADIENFTRDEMYAYYQNYYAPNNAVVVIVGDFSTPKVLAMVRKYFGPIPSHPIQHHFITPEPPQQGERRVIVRRPGSTPQMMMVYHIPGFGSPDRYALDVLETVLSGGRTSRLYQDMIQTGLASDAEAYDYGLRDPDLIYFGATPQPGHTNAEMEHALLAEITKLQTAAISQEELTRAINQAEAGYIFSKDSVTEQGEELGEDAMKGDWRYGETYVAHLRQVTPADVQRVAQKYLTADNRTVGYFEPLPLAPGQVLPMGGGGGGDTSPVAHFKPALVPPADDYRPALSAAAGGTVDVNAVPKPTKVVLSNGLTVVVQEDHANPTISLSGAIMTAGDDADPAEAQGLAGFTAGLLSRGTKTRSMLQIATALENVGADVGVSGGDEYASIGGESLTQNFPLMLEILSDELRNPSFPQSEIDKTRDESLAGIQEARSETSVLADIAFADALYPPGHPYHAPTLDQQAAFLKGVTRQQLVQFHDTHYAPNQTILTIVGDVNTAQAIALVKQYFGSWAAQPGLKRVTIPAVAPAPSPLKTQVIYVPGKAQTDVRYGYPGLLTRRDPDFYKVVVLDTILGGGSGLDSRLFTNVRDRLGLVYSIYSYTDASLGAGPFEIAFGANPSNVDPAIAETERQMGLLRAQGVTPTEVQHAISYLTGSYPVTLSTDSAVAGQLLVAQIYGLGLDYIQKHNSYYQSLTPGDINAVVKKYIRPDTGALVIAGTYTGKYAPHP